MTESRPLLNSIISKWLSDYRESGGGWAEITQKDVHDLYSIIHCLIGLKCGADSDGDRPIDIHLIDRTLFWPYQFQDVPYDHKSPSKEVLQTLLDNAQIANSQLGDFLKTWPTPSN